ncbi:MAG: hypothetical protein ACLQE9_16640 [Roseiarcus sp.]
MQFHTFPTRRAALQGLGAVGAAPFAPGFARSRTYRPSVGAIRWDAWYDPADGAVARAVEAALGSARYHDRMPFFGRETGPDSVRIDGDSQAVMDREIGAASHAGLDYWAFMGYAPDDPMTNALDLYLSSARRGQIGFCMIGSIANGGTPGHFSSRTSHEVAMMRERGYVRVLAGRPLYYLFSEPKERFSVEWGGDQGVAGLVAFMRSAAKSQGSGDPYIVLLGADAALAEAFGCDAIGDYAIVGHADRSPYRKLTEDAEKRWDQLAGSGIAMVPTAMTGWDQRPLVENPPFWDRANLKKGVGLDKCYERATQAEIARHLQQAIAWSESHRAASPAQTILVYAWDECAEGFGALVPSFRRGEADGDGSRLDAIRKVLTGSE